MAEPAPKLDGKSIYDTEGTAPSDASSKPNLKALEGGGETTDPKRGHLKEAGSKDQSPDALQEAEQNVSDNPDNSNVVGRGYTKSTPERSVWSRYTQNRRRALLVGGGLTALFAAIGVTILLLLLPLKILHIVNNLQDRFFSAPQTAVNKETDVLFSKYIKRYVLPGLNSCKAGSTIDKSCTPKDIQGNSLVSKLYKGWRTSKLEYTLAKDYGLEFQKVGSKYYMKAPALSASSIDLREFENNSNLSLDDFIKQSGDSQFKNVSRTQLRAYVDNSLNSGTRWKSTMYRFKVGPFLEEKYGIKRCIAACKKLDNYADWKDQKKLAAKAYLIDRVITPRSQSLGIVLQCLLSGVGDSGVCSINPEKPETSCAGDCALNGEPETKWETNLRAELASYRATLGDKSADDLIKEVTAIRESGYSTYLFQKIFNPASTADKDVGALKSVTQSSKDTAKAADFAAKAAELGKSANIIGALNQAANIISAIGKAGPLLQKMTYVTNAGSMVNMFSMYRTYADEIKSNHVDSTIVGSFTDSLGAGDQDLQDPNTKQLGGLAEAEQSPLYDNLIGSGNNLSASATAFINSLLPAKAYAATPSYLCNNDQPVPAGKLICNEENLNYNPAAADLIAAEQTEPLKTITSIVNKYEGIKNSLFGGILSFVNSTLGKISGFLNSIATLIPGVSGLENQALAVFSKLSQWLVGEVIPSPIASKISGGRAFDLVAGGADLSGNDYAHHGLGGQALSTGQVTAIRNDQQLLANAQYQNQSFFARMFDESSNKSLVTKLAMAMPSNFNQVQVSLANLFMKPFQGFSFPGMRVQAAGNQDDPFGVTQYGYLPNDPIFSQDPEAYWLQNCVDPGQEGSPQVSLSADKQTYQWNSAAKLNPQNYMPENYSTNPCLLIQASVGSAGAIYDSTLLTSDDQGTSGVDASINQVPTTTAGSTLDTANLYKDSTSVACAPNTRDLGIQDGYTGGQLFKIRICAIPNLPSTGEESNGGYGVSGGSGQAVVNSRVSGAVYAMVKAAAANGVNLTAISSFRTMSHQEALCNANSGCANGDYTKVAKPGTSNHQAGLAIDFGGGLPSTPGPISGNQFWDWLSANAANFGYKNYPSEAWHWSPTGN